MAGEGQCRESILVEAVEYVQRARDGKSVAKTAFLFPWMLSSRLNKLQGGGHVYFFISSTQCNMGQVEGDKITYHGI